MLTLAERVALRLRPAELADVWKSIRRIRRRTCTAGGMVFWVDPASNFGSRLLVDQAYEAEFTSQLLSQLRPKAVFWDVGANEGYFSILAARAVGPGQVVCIEPQERLWPVILQNVRLNHHHNITLLPYAVGAQRAESEMMLFPSTNTGASRLPDAFRSLICRKQRVSVVPLDELIAAQSPEGIDVLKLDVEGYEILALQGMGNWLSPERVRHLFIEVHPSQLVVLNQSVEMLHALLTGRGYRLIAPGSVEHWAGH